MVTALQFFMGSDEVKEESDSEAEVLNLITLIFSFLSNFCHFLVLKNENVIIREVGMATRVNKKSRKREKQMEKVKKTLKVRMCGARKAIISKLILSLFCHPETQQFQKSTGI